ncbi:MAG: hypothetical protein GF375_05570, partial [Candidatus Omnitrophica bacterium]|nr:hypothetical protein [Candidatus Omnitrophota bacterium]MBD3269456.1 hypothetical protein [Candidatus Omnitrophota bacterium]
MVIKDFKIIEKLIKPEKIYNIYHFKPIESFSIDSRTSCSNCAFIALRGKHKDGHNYIKAAIKRGAGLIIAEEFIPLEKRVPFFVVDDCYRVLYPLINFVRRKHDPVVCAVSGSLGKTTTKEMLGFLLEGERRVKTSEKTENNILGIAKTFFSLKDEQIVVAEAGTNFTGEIKNIAGAIKPDIGIITFIKPVHLK